MDDANDWSAQDSSRKRVVNATNKEKERIPRNRPLLQRSDPSSVWFLAGSFCLSQHQSRISGRCFVISHESLRFLSVVRCQIMRPSKTDGLKPKLRLHFERSRRIAGRDHI